MSLQRLSTEQQETYHESGFLTGLAVFNETEVTELNLRIKALKPGESHFSILIRGIVRAVGYMMIAHIRKY
ncbi:hypothetical protein P4361_18430 [Fictibacillus sp. B-59209]|uniref:hypothetical protein n=1 Tax=Fictibacillus sp. B-59209 TaxID=3024873 RepID=UPI002E2024B8|nr:hypothetical protein [Fictibacillus sp. B-59209]